MSLGGLATGTSGAISVFWLIEWAMGVGIFLVRYWRHRGNLLSLRLARPLLQTLPQRDPGLHLPTMLP